FANGFFPSTGGETSHPRSRHQSGIAGIRPEAPLPSSRRPTDPSRLRPSLVHTAPPKPASLRTQELAPPVSEPPPRSLRASEPPPRSLRAGEPPPRSLRAGAVPRSRPPSQLPSPEGMPWVTPHGSLAG